MKFSDIEQVFNSGEEKPVEELTSKIQKLNLNDLKKITRRFDDFLKLYLAYKEKYPVPIYQRHFLDQTAFLLMTIAQGNCRCKIYKTVYSNIVAEEHAGHIKIIERIKSPEEGVYMRHKCVCSYCGAKFTVSEVEDIYGYTAKWSSGF